MLIQDWLQRVHNLLQLSPRSRRKRISMPIVASDVQLLESRVVLAAKPTAPSGFAAEAVASDEVQLTWRDVKNEKGYRIYIDQGDGWEELDTTRANAKSYTVTDLDPGTEYSFCVEAFNAGGARKSRIVTVTTQADAPDAPEDLTADGVSDSEIELTWSDVDNEDGYSIYQLVGRNWKLIGETEADETGFVADGLDPDTEYTFYVSAFNDDGEGDSEEVSGTTLAEDDWGFEGEDEDDDEDEQGPDGGPDQQSGFRAEYLNDSSVKFTWDAKQGVNRYDIFVSFGAGQFNPMSGGYPLKLATVSGSETSFTLRNFYNDFGADLTFHLVSYDARGNVSVQTTTLDANDDQGGFRGPQPRPVDTTQPGQPDDGGWNDLGGSPFGNLGNPLL